MTADEFNALPLEARRFIESNSGCLSCGNSKEKLNRAFELYKSSKKMKSYQVMGGGVNYQKGESTGVLYAISEDDSPNEIREKIKVAKLIHKSNPEMFLSFDEKEMEVVLKSLPAVKVIVIDDKK